MDEFARSLAKVLVSEGGYTNNKNDPGGATNKGIIQRVFSEWLVSKGKPMRDVRTIADAEVSAIYRERYWDIAKLDKLAPGVSYVVFDGNVNSGVSQSIKWLQRALAAMNLYQGAIDGVIGQGTILAAAGVSDNDSLVAAIEDRRLAFMKALKTWKYFGKGWAARVASVKAVGQAWATGSVGVPDHVYAPGGDAKAFIADAAPEPLAGVGHAVAGTGLGIGGVTTYVDSIKDKLAAYSGISQILDHAVMWLGVTSIAVAGAGSAYAWYSSRVKAKRADVLDLPTTPQAAAVPPAVPV
jgi:lysozyme family protein